MSRCTSQRDGGRSSGSPTLGSSLPQASTSTATASPRPKKRRKQSQYKDEFQQVSSPAFVDRWRIEGMGYGAEVFYEPCFIPAIEANAWYDILLALDTWYQPTLKLYGRTFPQSRHIAAYTTEPGLTLNYSGSEIEMHHPYPPVLARMQERLEEELGVKFNHCMLNRYEDGSVIIGKHSDNLNNLVIASVSLGAERTFILSPRIPSRSTPKKRQISEQVEKALVGRKNVRMTLANGSLLVMQGRTQEFWKHEIPREPAIKKGRISLTFRQLV